MYADPDRPPPSIVADFALMETKPGAMERYWRLAIKTRNYIWALKAAGNLGGPYPWISVSCARRLEEDHFSKIPVEHRDETIAARWREWDDEYKEIVSASPKWRLKGMIHELSRRRYAGTSWPHDQEDDEMVYIWETTADRAVAKEISSTFKHVRNGKFVDVIFSYSLDNHSRSSSLTNTPSSIRR